MPRLIAPVLAILLAAASSTRAQEARPVESHRASLQADQVLLPALAVAALLGAFFTAVRRWCAPSTFTREEDGPEPVFQPVEPPRLRVVSRTPEVSDPRRRRP